MGEFLPQGLFLARVSFISADFLGVFLYPDEGAAVVCLRFLGLALNADEGAADPVDEAGADNDEKERDP